MRDPVRAAVVEAAAFTPSMPASAMMVASKVVIGGALLISLSGCSSGCDSGGSCYYSPIEAATQLPPHAADSQSTLISCEKVGGDAFAAWQCQRFYARQKINGDCLTVPGGEFGIRQCQQFYTRMAERPSPAAAASVALSDTGSPSTTRSNTAVPSGHDDVALVKEGGTFKVPVLINGVIQLRFTVDSGATDVSIPADVVATLMRTDTLRPEDFLGTQIYRMADGSTAPSKTFRIRSLKVGNKVIENVTGSMTNVEGSLLLGQSFLSRFRRVSFNYNRQVLELE